MIKTTENINGTNLRCDEVPSKSLKDIVDSPQPRPVDAAAVWQKIKVSADIPPNDLFVKPPSYLADRPASQCSTYILPT